MRIAREKRTGARASKLRRRGGRGEATKEPEKEWPGGQEENPRKYSVLENQVKKTYLGGGKTQLSNAASWHL